MKVLVFGGARSGISVAKLLRQHGYRVTITDKEPIIEKDKLLSLGIDVYDGGHPDWLIDEEWDFVVKNPGIPYSNIYISRLVARQVAIINEIEVADWFGKFQYGAITGTNGKTTTTTLLFECLKQEFSHALLAGNIGIPLSQLLVDGIVEGVVALEISAFQLSASPSFHPHVAVIMNLTPDHLDYYNDLHDYYQAKTLIYRNQGPADFFLLNIDDAMCVKYCQDIPSTVITFSTKQTADLMISDGWVLLFNEKLFELQSLQMVGMHNVQNAMVAAAMAKLLGVKVANIMHVLREFKGVEHRIELVAQIKGVKYYNDSKATNTDATIVALKAFEQPIILLAGGYDKHTGFDDLKPYLHHVKQMIVFGSTKEQLKQLDPKALLCDNLYEAVQLAKGMAESGDCVVLSPACASYDQFDNFEQRGRLFKQYVKE
jgi:UDP-N-acetylmuramoylalanine--D-glutamate ligase